MNLINTERKTKKDMSTVMNEIYGFKATGSSCQARYVQKIKELNKMP